MPATDLVKFRQTLLLISEFLGLADAAGVSNVNMGSNANADGSNVSLTGRVEVQRRRITTDGRIKLKMNMFGAHGSMSLSVATFSTKVVQGNGSSGAKRARYVAPVRILEIVDTMCASCITMFFFRIFCLNDDVVYYLFRDSQEVTLV